MYLVSGRRWYIMKFFDSVLIILSQSVTVYTCAKRQPLPKSTGSTAAKSDSTAAKVWGRTGQE